MQRRWMRIIESGNDRHPGAALVRLAQRADEMHRAELAASAEETGDAVAHPDQCADDPHHLTRESER